jgi:hypothetical protein
MQRGDVVLSVRPAQSEARMSFAGLGDLLDPVADSLLPRLEVPQRTALEVALLRRVPAGVPPNEREIGAAVLALLRVLAAESAVLLAIDDVQWLDRASAEVLAFALLGGVDVLGARAVGRTRLATRAARRFIGVFAGARGRACVRCRRR